MSLRLGWSYLSASMKHRTGARPAMADGAQRAHGGGEGLAAAHRQLERGERPSTANSSASPGASRAGSPHLRDRLGELVVGRARRQAVHRLDHGQDRVPRQLVAAGVGRGDERDHVAGARVQRLEHQSRLAHAGAGRRRARCSAPGVRVEEVRRARRSRRRGRREIAPELARSKVRRVGRVFAAGERPRLPSGGVGPTGSSQRPRRRPRRGRCRRRCRSASRRGRARRSPRRSARPSPRRRAAPPRISRALAKRRFGSFSSARRISASSWRRAGRRSARDGGRRDLGQVALEQRRQRRPRRTACGRTTIS